jgi:hypothetical protein
MEQQLISNLNEIQVGDEIIISANSELKYLKILRLPIKKNSSVFKVSLRRDVMSFPNSNYTWKKRIFEQDVTKHNDVMYQDLYSRDIFLVKREKTII